MNENGTKSEFSSMNVSVTTEPNIFLELKDSMDVTKKNTIVANFENCGTEEISQPITCAWSFTPKIAAFDPPEECALVIPSDVMAEKQKYDIHILAILGNTKVAESKATFVTQQVPLSLEIVGSEVVFVPYKRNVSIEFKYRKYGDDTEENLSCTCTSSTSDTCPQDAFYPSTAFPTSVLPQSFVGNYRASFIITCKDGRESESVEAQLKLIVPDHEIPEITLKQDAYSIPPGKSVMYFIEMDLSEFKNILPMQISMKNSGAPGATVHNDMPKPKFVQSTQQKVFVEFVVKNLAPNSMFSFVFELQYVNGRSLVSLIKSIIIPPSLTGGKLQIMENPGSCLVNLVVSEVKSTDPDITYQLIAGENFRHQETTSSIIENIFPPKNSVMKVEVRNSHGALLTIKQEEILNTCETVTDNDINIIKEDCLAGNVKKCRANLINMLYLNANKKTIEFAEKLEQDLSQTSSDETNSIDLTTLISIGRRNLNDSSRQKRSITDGVNSVKMALSNYLSSGVGVIPTDIFSELKTFIKNGCNLVKERGSRPIITHESGDTLIQVLSSYINVYINTEILDTDTENEDGVKINWNRGVFGLGTGHPGVCVAIVVYSPDLSQDKHYVLNNTADVLASRYVDVILTDTSNNQTLEMFNFLLSQNFDSDLEKDDGHTLMCSRNNGYVAYSSAIISGIDPSVASCWITGYGFYGLSYASYTDGTSTESKTSESSSNLAETDSYTSEPTAVDTTRVTAPPLVAKTEYTKFAYKFENLNEIRKISINTSLENHYQKINRLVNVKVLDYVPGSVIIKYLVNGTNDNVEDAIGTFKKDINDGAVDIEIDGKKYQLQNLGDDEIRSKFPKSKRTNKWMHIIMGVVISVFVLMVILVLLTAFVVRYLYRGRNKVQCTENPPAGNGMNIPKGVAMLVPFGKTSYESGLSTQQDMFAIGSIPEPAKYDIPDPDTIKQTPRIPTAIQGNLIHREQSAFVKDEDVNDDDDEELRDTFGNEN